MKIGDLAPAHGDWIVTRSYDVGFECRRCGAEQPMKPPVRLSYWQEIAAAFIKAHKQCQQPAEVLLYGTPPPTRAAEERG